MKELFRQNAYGDTWQEPELFDQPGLPVADVPAVPMSDLVNALHVRHQSRTVADLLEELGAR